MNKNIRKLDIEKVLFFDIETVSANKELDKDSREYDSYAWSIRDVPTGFVPPAKDVLIHYKKMAALKSQFNKIVVISIGYVKGTTLYYKSLVGEQKDVIEEFYGIVNSTGFKLCGHNIIGFDVPTVRMKAFEENIDFNLIPERINDVDKKPWLITEELLDTMVMLKGTAYYNISLDDACRLAGVETSKDDITGGQVTEVYYNEGTERIAKYCNKDVIASARLFCAIQGKRGFITECIDKGAEELKEKEPINVIDHILASGELSPKVVEAIVEFTEENKLNKENVLILVKTAISNSKEFQKVTDEDIYELKEALGLVIDYSKIQVVADKGNLGKKEVDTVISQYVKSTKKVKLEIISLVEQYLTENNKIGQKRAKESFEFLKDNLK
ncbi:MAG: ribosomal protein L9 [Flavobacteriaceae bacterium]|jgi:ribosomal protein L9